MKLFRYFLPSVFLSSILLLGCAHTKVTSFKDTERSAGKTYSKIVVLAPFSDLELRSTAERTFASKLRENGASAVLAIEVIPPTRKPTKEEIEAKLVQDGFDGLFLVNLTQAYNETTTTPGYATTIWGKSGAITTYSGPSTISSPRLKFNLQLMDVSSKQNVWVSSTFTRAGSLTSRTTIFNSLADSAVKKLKEDRLIKGAPEPQSSASTPAPEPENQEAK